jgi:hypothetical protein
MAGNKRIDLLIEALSEIITDVPEAMLMLVGDYDSNPAIQENVARARDKAVALGVNDRVIFTGPVDELPDYYRLASVYASASLHEGFGVPLIEAMASGTPVVASQATAHPWVVGDAGLLVEPGDAREVAKSIVQVFTDDDLYGTLVRRGLARARKFSLERYYEGWRKIVQEATAWLPDQPYPRPSSLLDESVESTDLSEDSAATVYEVLQKGKLGILRSLTDVMQRDYAVHSNVPIIGPLIARLRRNLTSHLRRPYIDPTFERQVTFNKKLIDRLEELMDSCAEAIRRLDELEDRIKALETKYDSIQSSDS